MPINKSTITKVLNEGRLASKDSPVLYNKSYVSKNEMDSIVETLAFNITELKDKLKEANAQIDFLKRPKLNISMPVQRSVSIPVKTDEGGLGTHIRPTSGQVPIGNSDGTYTPGTLTDLTGILRTIVVTSGNVTAGSTSTTDYVYLVAGAHTITMPTAVGNTNRYTIKNNHSANITVNTTSSQTIDGTTSILLAPEEAVDLISNNSNWSII